MFATSRCLLRVAKNPEEGCLLEQSRLKNFFLYFLKKEAASLTGSMWFEIKTLRYIIT